MRISKYIQNFDKALSILDKIVPEGLRKFDPNNECKSIPYRAILMDLRDKIVPSDIMFFVDVFCLQITKVFKSISDEAVDWLENAVQQQAVYGVRQTYSNHLMLRAILALDSRDELLELYFNMSDDDAVFDIVGNIFLELGTNAPLYVDDEFVNKWILKLPPVIRNKYRNIKDVDAFSYREKDIIQDLFSYFSSSSFNANSNTSIRVSTAVIELLGPGPVREFPSDSELRVMYPKLAIRMLRDYLRFIDPIKPCDKLRRLYGIVDTRELLEHLIDICFDNYDVNIKHIACLLFGCSYVDITDHFGNVLVCTDLFLEGWTQL